MGEIETRVKVACALVGADYNMTLGQVMDFIPVDQVYAYAHDEEMDLTEVVREVLKRSMAVDEGLELLAAETQIERKDLDGLTNWFDVFEYSAVHQIYLLEVMRFALQTYGAHLLRADVNEEDSVKTDTAKSDSGKAKSKLGRDKVAFKHELDRLRQSKGLLDGKASRHEKREDRQRKNRDRKVNQARGFNVGGKGNN